MSELFNRYLGANVKLVSGVAMTGAHAEGVLREPEGEWFVVETSAGRMYLRRDLTFFIEAEAPANPLATLPRSLGGGG